MYFYILKKILRCAGWAFNCLLVIEEFLDDLHFKVEKICNYFSQG